MTSKQTGIATLLVALITLWSLAGIGWLSWPSTSGDGSFLVVSQAYAGDPDAMSDDPEGTTSAESQTAPIVEEPAVDQGRTDEELPESDIIQTVVQIAALVFKTSGVLY